MPITNGMGHSLSTIDKQDGFGKYINLNIQMWEHVFDRNPYWDRRYVYIDLTCGSGMNPWEGVKGSPLLFIDNASLFENIKFDCHFIDCEEGNINQLKYVIGEQSGKTNIKYYCEDNNKIIDTILEQYNSKQLFGLVYMDFNGKPDFDLLKKISHKTEKLDLFVRCPTRILKRCRFQGQKPLLDEMRNINKKVWLIREKAIDDIHWDWTFLFGTNYADFGEWGKLGFYRTDKPKGAKILKDLSYTQKEILEIEQPTLDMEMAIEKRSKGMCEVCKKEKATQNHHFKYNSKMNADDCINVCHRCHCILEGVSE